MRVHSMNTKSLDAMVPKIRLAPWRYHVCSGELPIHTTNSLFTGQDACAFDEHQEFKRDGPKIRLAPRRYQVCLDELPMHTSDSLFTGLGYAPLPRHLRSLLSAGGWFFVWSFVALFLSCRVLCGVVLVVSCRVVRVVCLCV